MLNLFARIEIDRQTASAISGQQPVAHSLPPIVNMLPATVKHAMARFFSHTDPEGPIRLRWFRDMQVSPRGVALLAFANALYTVQARPVLARSVIESMTRTDFMFAWTALHILVAHRDTISIPLPLEMTNRQYTAAKYRAGDMHNPPPTTFTHMRFCHLLGCSQPVSYHVPFADAEHYGGDLDQLAIDIGRVVCARQKSDQMFNRLQRRMRESQAEPLARTVTAMVTALSVTNDPDERQRLEDDLRKQHDKLFTHQAKNTRATIKVMLTRPCNEAPAIDLRTVGALVVRRNSARGRSRVYTTCTLCASPTIYSMDRHGPNGFVCGSCSPEWLWGEHGRWCVSCGYVEQPGALPELYGEAEAQARENRSSSKIQGSSMRPRTLKAHVARERHDHQLKEQAVRDGKLRPEDTGVPPSVAPDTSDSLAAPVASLETQAAVDRRKARKQRAVKPRRRNTATEYKLGRTLLAVHPSSMSSRMEPMGSRVVYDDRPGGTHTTLAVTLCMPCQGRVRRGTVSLSETLTQTTADDNEFRVHGHLLSFDSKRSAAIRYRMRRPLSRVAVERIEERKRKRPTPVKTVMLSAEESLVTPLEASQK